MADKPRRAEQIRTACDPKETASTLLEAYETIGEPASEVRASTESELEGSAPERLADAGRSRFSMAQMLARKYWAHLSSRARRRLGEHAAEAEDCVCEALHRVLEGKVRFAQSDEQYVIAAMMIVVDNVSRHAIRSCARLEPIGEEPVDPNSGRDWHQAGQSLLTRDLATALSALTSGEREVLRLRFYGGHSIAQIAELRRVQSQTVKELERRGLRKLRDALAQYA